MDSTDTAGSVTAPDRTFAIIAHIAGLLTTWIGPLVIYLIKKPDPAEAFTTENAKEALNFQITVFIVCVGLMITLVGAFLLFIPMVFNLVCSIMAAVKASNGETWKYPLTIRLVK